MRPEELSYIPHEDDIRTFAAQLAQAGTWAEFGVAGGGSARHFIHLMPDNTEIHLFDSFKGLPEEWDFNGDINKIGKFAQDKTPTFNDIRVHIHEGWFADTLPTAELGVLDFVHIDCDIYSATKTVFDYIQVKQGTIILFDEYHGYTDYKNHERKAYMEWSERTGHQLEWLAISRKEAVGRIV